MTRATSRAGAVRRFPIVVGALAVASPTVFCIARAELDDAAKQRWDANVLHGLAAIVVAFVLVALAGAVRGRRPDAVRRALPGLASAIVLTAAVLWMVPPRMRVQFDESSLVGTSLSMHERRECTMVTSAVPFHGELVPVQTLVDKRPPLFPFLVALVHDVAGPRPANAFVVNALALALALFLAHRSVAERDGAIAGFAAQLLLLAVPTTVVFATCAGFDFLATVLLGATLLAARAFLEVPDRRRFVMLVATGLACSFTRYESLFAVLLVAAVVVWRVRGRWSPGRIEALLLATLPTLVVPLVLLLLVSREAHFRAEAGGQPLFAGSHALGNAPALVRAWLQPSLFAATPGPVTFVALFAWIVWWWRRRRLPRDLALVIPVVGVTCLVVFWVGSDPENPGALRLYLPLAFATALSPLLLVGAFGTRVAPWLLGAAALVAAVRVDAVRRGVAFPQLDGERLTAVVAEELARPEFDAATTLWVTTIAQHVVTTGRAAIPPALFLRSREDVERWVAEGSVRAVFLLETPHDRGLAGGLGDPRDVLSVTSPRLVVHTGGAVPLSIHRLR